MTREILVFATLLTLSAGLLGAYALLCLRNRPQTMFATTGRLTLSMLLGFIGVVGVWLVCPLLEIYATLQRRLGR